MNVLWRLFAGRNPNSKEWCMRKIRTMIFMSSMVLFCILLYIASIWSDGLKILYLPVASSGLKEMAKYKTAPLLELAYLLDIHPIKILVTLWFIVGVLGMGISCAVKRSASRSG